MTGFAPQDPVISHPPMVKPVELEVRELPPPGPRHTVGVDIRRDHLAGMPLGNPYVSVWCSCGWKGDTITIPVEGDRFDPFTDVGAEVFEEAARAWRFHVRLSNRVYRIDKRLRRQARAKIEPVDLSRTPEFAIEEARRARSTEEEE